MIPIHRSTLGRLFSLALILALAGCSLSASPAARKVTPTTGQAAQPAAQGATVVGAAAATSGAAMSSATAPAGPAAGGAASGDAITIARATQTANPCQFPEGWALYAIRSGDTLYHLATGRGVTVDRLMKANCLTSTILHVGQIISLPAAGSTPDSGGALSESGSCPSIFSCPVGGFPPLDFVAGASGDPAFQECPSAGRQAILASSDRGQPGDRLFFFACNFKTPLALAAVTYPDGTQRQINLVRSLPGYPQTVQGRIVDFPVLPGLAVSADPYTLVITGADGQTGMKRFWVLPATGPRILVTPLAGAPDQAFEIYYIYFKYPSTLGVVLYGEETPSATTTHALGARHAWSTKIDRPWAADNNGMGWTKEVVAPDPADLKGAYAIDYRSSDPANPLELMAYFWVR